MALFCRRIEQHTAKLTVGASVGELDGAADDGDKVGEPVVGEAGVVASVKQTTQERMPLGLEVKLIGNHNDVDTFMHWGQLNIGSRYIRALAW